MYALHFTRLSKGVYLSNVTRYNLNKIVVYNTVISLQCSIKYLIGVNDTCVIFDIMNETRLKQNSIQNEKHVRISFSYDKMFSARNSLVTVTGF